MPCTAPATHETAGLTGIPAAARL